jgi:hypothetical protein
MAILCWYCFYLSVCGLHCQQSGHKFIASAAYYDADTDSGEDEVLLHIPRLTPPGGCSTAQKYHFSQAFGL